MQKERKHILLCVAGGTPQIITETLWALMQAPHNERVDEIRVITTKEGRRKVLEHLLDAENGRFHQFCRDFPEFAFERPLHKRIKFEESGLYLLTHKETGVPSPRDDDGARLQDILTTEENQKAANQICDIVHEVTLDANVQSRLRLLESAFTLRFDLKDRKVIFGSCEAKLKPKDFFVYLLFAYYRKLNLGEDGWLILDGVEKEHVNAVCRLLLHAKHRRVQPDEADGHIQAFALNMARGEYVYRAYKEGMKRVLKTSNEEYTATEIKNFFHVAIGKIEKDLERAEFPPECFLPPKGELRSEKRAFGLPLPPDRIEELPVA